LERRGQWDPEDLGYLLDPEYLYYLAVLAVLYYPADPEDREQ
jgi:hypothetical protein